MEGDRGDGFVLEQGYNISIHALRVEGDLVYRLKYTRYCLISIHALRVEGDVASGSAGRSYVSNFYPRPPGGGRLDLITICILQDL